MTAHCWLCGRPRGPSPDGLGSHCRRKLATPRTTRPAVWPGHTQPALEDITVTDTVTYRPAAKLREGDFIAKTDGTFHEITSLVQVHSPMQFAMVTLADGFEVSIPHTQEVNWRPAVGETHQGFDIAGDPATHRGPREKCHDPACEVTVPDTAAATRQCGHDDYHQPHPWHDRPATWCPGWTD